MDHSHLRLFDPDRSEQARSEQTRCEQRSEQRSEQQRAAAAERTNVHYTRVVGEARVAVSVGDLMPILAEAWQSRRAWLGDFSADRVIISQDLYEVLLAYKRLNKTAA